MKEFVVRFTKEFGFLLDSLPHSVSTCTSLSIMEAPRSGLIQLPLLGVSFVRLNRKIEFPSSLELLLSSEAILKSRPG